MEFKIHTNFSEIEMNSETYSPNMLKYRKAETYLNSISKAAYYECFYNKLEQTFTAKLLNCNNLTLSEVYHITSQLNSL